MTDRQLALGRIFLVEDDDTIQAMLTMLLKRSGYSVTSFSFGQDALAYLSDAQDLPDVILLDLRLPDMNGDDIYRAIQCQQNLSGIPIILMTAEPDGPQVAEQLGVSGFLAKPFTPVALLQLTEMICSPA